MKKNLAIIVAVSDNWAFAAGNIAIALERYMSIDYDLFIYTMDMKKNDIDILNSINHCNVVEFQFADGFVSYMMEALPESCRFKNQRKFMRFCHYEVFAILENYRNAYWIDADMSIQGDLAEMMQYAPFGITSDSPWKVRNQFIKDIPDFDMEKDAVCSGIMMLNDTLPYKEIYKWLYENTKKYAPYMKNGDQAIINLMLQHFKINPTLMPREVYQCIDFKKEAINAKVVHFGTDKKVWNTNIKLNSFPEWYRIHLKWLAMGGSDFEYREKIIPENIYTCYSDLKREYDHLHICYSDLKREYDHLQGSFKLCVRVLNNLQKYTPKKKVILYGCGSNYRIFEKGLRVIYDVVAVADKYKAGEELEREKIIGIDEIHNITFDAIVITPYEYQAIIQDLEKIGIMYNRILLLDNLLDEWRGECV